MSLKPELDLILKQALGSPGTIHVVKASPGQGKTHSTVEALADLLHTGSVTRILWAVRETVADKSLGQEAHSKLKAAGLQTTLVQGRPVIRKAVMRSTLTWGPTSRGRVQQLHRDQFHWSGAPEVKIISHAHLPLIYGKDARSRGGRHLQQLRAAQLLVIDEDPSDVFLVDETLLKTRDNARARANLRLNASFFEAKRDDVSQAFMQLFQRAAAGEFNSEARRTGRQHSLSGAPFLKALLDTLPARPAWPTFARNLGLTAYFGYGSNISPWVAQHLRHALKDYERGLPPSAQFGLTWFSQNPRPELRFNLSQYRAFPTSVLILDAYAHRLHYEAAFRPSPIEIHAVGPNLTLEVAVAPGTGRQRSRVRSHQDTEHLLNLMEQVLDYAATHGNTLLLCHKDTREPYRQALAQALACVPLPTDTAVQTHHWKAGRGSNQWEGWNIIALEDFHYPQHCAQHTLTALYPYDTAGDAQLRATLAGLHRVSEQLQMLHRGRQTLATTRGWRHTPGVTLLYDMDFGLLNSEVRRTGSVHFTRPDQRTTRPRFSRVITQVSRELTTLLGGIPLSLFEVLDLEQRKATMKPETRAHLTEKLRQLTLASPHALPILRAWCTTGALPPCTQTRAVQATSRHALTSAIQASAPALQLYSTLYPTAAPPGIKRTQNAVMAATQSAAQDALDQLFAPP